MRNHSSNDSRFSVASVQNQKVMGHNRNMPLKDKISLGPIEKYTIYNRFPWKLTLHLILLVLTSIVITVNVQQNQGQQRSQIYVWYKKFLLNAKEEEVPTMDDFNRQKRLFKVDEVKAFMNTSLDNYYDMFDNSDEFENYQFDDYVGNASLFVISLNPK